MKNPIIDAIFLLGGILMLIFSKSLAELFTPRSVLFGSSSRHQGLRRGINKVFFSLVGICSIVFSSLMLGPFLIKTLGIPLLLICLIFITIIVIWAMARYQKKQAERLKSKRVWVKPKKMTKDSIFPGKY